MGGSLMHYQFNFNLTKIAHRFLSLERGTASEQAIEKKKEVPHTSVASLSGGFAFYGILAFSYALIAFLCSSIVVVFFFFVFFLHLLAFPMSKVKPI